MMAQPAEGPATAALVKVQLSMDPDTDDPLVDRAVAAVNAYVRRLPCAQVDVWPADVELGAVMLGARVRRRTNSPGGIEAMTDAGVAYVSRSDPDVAMLLQLGAYAGPRVG